MPAHKQHRVGRAESQHRNLRLVRPAAASISNCLLIELFDACAESRPSHLAADCNKRRPEMKSRKCSCPYSPARKEMRRALSRWDPNFADLQLAPTRHPLNRDGLEPSGLLPRFARGKWPRTKFALRENPHTARWARQADPTDPALAVCRKASRRLAREPDPARFAPAPLDSGCPAQPVHFAAAW